MVRFPRVTPAEPKVVRTPLIAVLFLFVTSVPLLYGYFTTPEGKGFLWTTRLNAQDQSAYLAWIEQGRSGHALFDNPFTHEPHARRLFMPLFLVTGLIARATGLSALVAWLVVRAVLVFLLPFAVMRWIRIQGVPREQQGMALAFVLVSSGLGWALEGAGIASADVGIPEAITFASAYQAPLFVASVMLMLTALGPAFQKAPVSRRGVALSAAAGFVLAWVHPYDAGTLVLVATAALVIQRMTRGAEARLWSLTPVLVAAAAPLAVQAAILRTEPVYRIWSQTVPGLSPAPQGFLLAYGLLVPLAGFGLFALSKTDRERALKLGLWIGVTACLLYAPVSYQRRFVHGLHLPICVLAAAGWDLLCKRSKIAGPRKRWAQCLLLGVLSLTNVTMIAKDLRGYSAGVAPFYIRTEYLDAFAWMRSHTPHEAVVLSTLPSGNFIAAYAGNRLFIGHGDLTLLAEQKKALAAAFFRSNDEDDMKRRLLAEARVQYVYYSDLEQASGTYRPEEKGYLEPVYQNPRVRVFRVRASR